MASAAGLKRRVPRGDAGARRAPCFGRAVLPDLVVSHHVVICVVEKDSTIVIVLDLVVVECVVSSIVDTDAWTTILLGLVVGDLATGPLLDGYAIERAGSCPVMDGLRSGTCVEQVDADII